ncbi:MAG TPA: isoprenylcysteine carboxylmethyltransferase family protein [bacterium]|nr:isoprenylcysteine carboxylmethyltransferase family protein [bacterium]
MANTHVTEGANTVVVGGGPAGFSSSSAERGARVRFPPPLIVVICILVGVVFQYAVTRAPVPVDRAISAMGGILILMIGLGFIASARILFMRTGQNPAPWTPSSELILKGPYRFTRNPMYLGITLFEIGSGLAVNNLWISLFAAPALVTVHFIAVLPEERYLSKKFGESYKTYRAQVRRYL